MALPASAFYGPAEIDYMKLVPDWFYKKQDVDPLASITQANVMQEKREKVDKMREAEEIERQLAEMYQQQAEQGPVDVTSEEFGDSVSGLLAREGDIGRLIQFENSRPKPTSLDDQVSLASKFQKMGATQQAEEILSQAGISVDLPEKAAKGAASGRGSGWSYMYDRTTGEQVVLPKSQSIEEEQARLKQYSKTKPKIKQGKDETLEDIIKEAQSKTETMNQVEAYKQVLRDNPNDPVARSVVERAEALLARNAQSDGGPKASATPVNPDAPPQGRRYQDRRNPKTGEIVRVYLD